MSISIIEKYNRSRYNILKWFTVGWAIWYGRYLMTNFTQDKTILAISAIIGIIGIGIWAVNLFRYQKLSKVINADKKLREALNDELVVQNRNKALIVGYIVLMMGIVCFMVSSIFSNITSQLVCQSLLYMGVLSVLIAALIYNRD